MDKKMSLYRDLPDDLKKHIKSPAQFNLLGELGFFSRLTIPDVFPYEFEHEQTSTFQFLCVKYHGMGHFQLVAIDTTREERKFILLVVGGSDDWQRKNNTILSQIKDENFCDLYDLSLYAYKTNDNLIYITPNEAKDHANQARFAEFLFSCITD